MGWLFKNPLDLMTGQFKNVIRQFWQEIFLNKKNIHPPVFLGFERFESVLIFQNF